MSNAGPELLEVILRQCQATAPEPWYPSAYAQATGTPRESLDPYLDQLRLGGVIRLTDWVQGTGQGYALTELGAHILASPRQLNRIRAGELPAAQLRRAPAVDTREILPTTWERGEAARAALTQATTPVVSLGLIALNVVWFIFGLA